MRPGQPPSQQRTAPLLRLAHPAEARQAESERFSVGSDRPEPPPREAGDADDGMSRLQRLLALAASKWSLPILDVLASRSARYNRLLTELDSVAPKVLTQTLRRLEAEGLLMSETVGKSGRSYSLTERGAQMRQELAPIRRWAACEGSDDPCRESA